MTTDGAAADVAETKAAEAVQPRNEAAIEVAEETSDVQGNGRGIAGVGGAVRERIDGLSGRMVATRLWRMACKTWHWGVT